MLQRHVVARDRDQAGQPRLGRQQIVVRVVRRERFGVIPDREQLPLALVEKAEVHLHHEVVRCIRKRQQPIAKRWLSVSHRETGLPHCHQMPRHIAAVDGADVVWLQHTQIGEVVPVVEVSMVPTQASERGERLFQPFRHVGSSDQMQVVGADRRHQLQTDVGRRRAHCDDRFRIGLKVVRRQPVRFRSHERVEELPVQRRVSERGGTCVGGEQSAPRLRGRADHRHDPRRQHPAEDQPSDNERGDLEIAERQTERALMTDPIREDHNRTDHDQPSAAAHRAQRDAARIGERALHQQRRLPLQHRAMRHVQPMQRAHDCVERDERLMRQREHRDERLLDTHDGVLSDGLVVGAPRLIERRPDNRDQQRRYPRRHDRAESQQRPTERRTGQNRPAADQKQQLRDLDGAASQVVDDLPLRHQ